MARTLIRRDSHFVGLLLVLVGQVMAREVGGHLHRVLNADEKVEELEVELRRQGFATLDVDFAKGHRRLASADVRHRRSQRGRWRARRRRLNGSLVRH